MFPTKGITDDWEIYLSNRPKATWCTWDCLDQSDTSMGKTLHYDDTLDDFSSCLVLAFSTQFPMIGNKHLDVMSFMLACDVVWMGLLA